MIHWQTLDPPRGGAPGAVAENYRDVDRRICPDCLAGVGLLEIDVESTARDAGNTSTIRDRLAPIPTLQGKTVRDGPQ